MSYSVLLAKLGFPRQVIDAHEGKYFVPQFSLTAPFDPRFGFPPIIVPLWSNGDWPGYIGVVTNWFGTGDGGFLKCYSESQCLSEIALTFDQLKVWLAFDFLCNIPVPEEVAHFAQSIGLCREDELEEYFAGCQDYMGLKNLDVFQGHLPQFFVGGSRNSQPAWVWPKATKEMVLELIERGQYQRAWHGINSPGLARAEVAELLEKILPYANDSRFGELVECWLHSTR